MADDPKARDLSTMAGFAARLDAGFQPNTHIDSAGDVYCAKCGGTRLVDARHVMSTDTDPWINRTSLFFLICRQCASRFTLLRFISSIGPEIACLPRVNGGLSTPHAPEAVAYYLDQAHRAQCLGARSAAVAMYRAALEQLLFEQGFKTGMLGPQIGALEAAITNGTAPAWAKELDTEYLALIKDLGNGAIHKNGGDISKQAALDGELVSALESLFAGLLFHVYELPHKKSGHLGTLRMTVAALKK